MRVPMIKYCQGLLVVKGWSKINSFKQLYHTILL